MTFWIILAVVLIFAVLAWLWSTKRKVKSLDDENNLEAWRPRTIRPLTKLELKAFGQIQTAAPHWVVLPQVSLSRFLKVKTSLPYGPWFYKVGRRCVDFLICSKGGDVLGVIELQTNTTLQSHISSGVLAKERTLTQASIPIWHFNPESPDALEQLHALIHVKTSDSMANTHNSQDFRPTDTAPRGAGIEAIELDDARWEQAWPTEDTRPTAYLDLAEENQSLDNVKIS